MEFGFMLLWTLVLGLTIGTITVMIYFPQEDLCEEIICSPTSEICADGFVVACTNTCVEGGCTSCTPDCSDHNSEEE